MGRAYLLLFQIFFQALCGFYWFASLFPELFWIIEIQEHYPDPKAAI